MKKPFKYALRKKYPKESRWNPLKTVSIPRPEFHEPSYCKICKKPTREGKLYCLEHVECHPYIDKLISQIDEKEKEEQRVLEKGIHAITNDSLTLKEILNHLKIHGGQSIERMAKELHLSIEAANIYAAYLIKHKKINYQTTNRGVTLLVPIKNRFLRRNNPDINLLQQEMSTLRYNPDINLLQQEMLALNPELPSQHLFPLKKYVDDNAQILLPATLSGDSQLLPKKAANFELLVTQQSPLIIVPEKSKRSVKKSLLTKLYFLSMNLHDITAWEDLWINCGGISGQGCRTGSYDIYVVSRHNERYKLIDVILDYGHETGKLVVRHIGNQGNIVIQIPRDAYQFQYENENTVILPYFLPVVFYKP